VGLSLVVLVVAGAIVARPLYVALATHTVRNRMTGQTRHFEDGLHAYLCGTGSPIADAERAGPCIAVVAGRHRYVVDAGEGSARNIQLGGLNMGKVEAILLTHFHSDHIADLGEMMLQHWAGGSNAQPTPVIGPEGVEQVVEGFNIAYRLDTGYRVAHHGPTTLPPTGAGGIAEPLVLGKEENASVVVVDKDGLRITAFKVDHRPVVPAVGYRFDYKGRSIVISGDTAYSPFLLEHSKGADLLFHDALNRGMVQLINENAHLSGSPSLGQITHDIPSYHASPEDAARIANSAGVRHLVYYHVIPPLPNRIVKYMFVGDARRYYKGPITVGSDGMLFSLPANSTEIIRKNLLK
jgi:ribonuclease Z